MLNEVRRKPEKPRLWKTGAWWRCGNDTYPWVGLGTTPVKAFKDFQAILKRNPAQ